STSRRLDSSTVRRPLQIRHPALLRLVFGLRLVGLRRRGGRRRRGRRRGGLRRGHRLGALLLGGLHGALRVLLHLLLDVAVRVFLVVVVDLAEQVGRLVEQLLLLVRLGHLI